MVDELVPPKDRTPDMAAGSLGDCAGVRCTLGCEGAFHLGEQDQQEPGVLAP
jgi:hypothetical protein